MMKNSFSTLIIVLLSLLLAATAQAQTDDWYAGTSLTYNDDDADRAIDDSLSGINFKFGRALNENFVMEGVLGFSDVSGYCEPGDCYPDHKFLDLSLNVLAFYDRDATFAPYVLAGAGYLGTNRSFGARSHSATGSLGLGFKWRLGQSNYSIGGEYRSRTEFEHGDNYTDTQMSLGLQYDFVGPARYLGGGQSASKGQWNVGSSIVWNDDEPDRVLDDSLSGIQFTASRDMTRHLTLEGLIGYSDIKAWCVPGDCYPDQTHLDISANLLGFYDRDATFAPYAMVGIGYLGKDADEGPQYVRNTGTDNRPTATWGLGFKWRLGQSKFSIRGQYRGRLAYRSSNVQDDRLITIGVEYRFGSKPRDLGVPPVGEPSDKPKDTDGDGVLDWWDECPDTPPGVEVTAKGCEIRDMERDADGDRVPDYRDHCLNTPVGAPVDAQGCSLDSDMDGVPTGEDRCPGSLPGAKVDEFGCDNDEDKDGVINPDDRCPNTRPNVEVDPYGCEIRDVISLPGVNFQSGSDLLAPGAEDLIKQIADTLRENEYLQIEVAGHTDSQGGEENNLGLSDRRAKTVFDYLFLYGVDPARLTFRGYGETQPIADNETSEGRAINRRVELRVIRK